MQKRTNGKGVSTKTLVRCGRALWMGRGKHGSVDRVTYAAQSRRRAINGLSTNMPHPLKLHPQCADMIGMPRRPFVRCAFAPSLKARRTICHAFLGDTLPSLMIAVYVLRTGTLLSRKLHPTCPDWPTNAALREEGPVRDLGLIFGQNHFTPLAGLVVLQNQTLCG